MNLLNCAIDSFLMEFRKCLLNKIVKRKENRRLLVALMCFPNNQVAVINDGRPL